MAEMRSSRSDPAPRSRCLRRTPLLRRCALLTLTLLSLTSDVRTVNADLVARNNHAAAVAAIESFEGGANAQQRPLLAAAMELVSTGNATDVLSNMNNLTPLSIMGSSQPHPANATTASKGGYVSKVELTWERWGHTAAYLPDSGMLLFTGGQISLSDGADAVTNDVFALKMPKNATDAKSQWTRLSSKHLAPHAFAARAVTHTGDHQGERLFLVGGATADCSASNPPVHVWSPSNGTTLGRWRTPTVAAGVTLPPRRKGASAVQVPVSLGLNATQAEEAEKQGGSAFMVLGGYMDYTTCNASIPANLSSPTAYPFVDLWVLGDETSKNSSGALSVRTMALDAKMPNMSVIDYSTVVLPANTTANVSSRVVFVGGRDVYGAFTPMNQLWTLDLSTSIWSRLQTTNGSDTGLDIPLGRMGHSSTLLGDGTILVHGGYVTTDVNQTASNDTYVLDPHFNPAVWRKVTPNINNGVAPRRAYHSAVLANDVLVLGFGQQGMGSMADGEVAGQQTTARVAAEDEPVSTSPVHFLDTQSSWGWTTEYGDIDKMRTADNQQAKQEAKEEKKKLSSPAAKVHTSSVAQSLPSLSNYVPAASSASDTDAGATNTDNEDSTPPVSKRNTAVIASVLGAAAIVASLGGLYFAKRRQRLNGDADSVNDDKYERFADSPNHPAPPVSSLWINQPMEWGRGLRRGASMASQAILGRTRSTRWGMAAQAGDGRDDGRQGMVSPGREQFMHSLPPASSHRSRAGMEGVEDIRALTDDFIRDILSDDEGNGGGGGGGAFIARRPTSKRKSVRRGVSMNRNQSSDSLTTSSVDGASHFSYPYLTATHRPSLSNLTTSPTLSEELTGGARGMLAAISPREAILRASLSRSPGSQPLYRLATGIVASPGGWSSPGSMGLLWGKNARLNERLQESFEAGPVRFENPFLDAHAEGERATQLEFDGTMVGGDDDGGATPRQTQSPLFPWESPQLTPRLATYQQPGTGVRLPIHPALLNAAVAHRGGGSARRTPGRSRPSLLRVTNEADGSYR